MKAAAVKNGLTANTLQGANIVATDVMASNGVIHVIDKVILPPAPAASTAKTAAMTNGITSPKDGAKVSGTAEIKGYATDPSFQKWQMDEQAEYEAKLCERDEKAQRSGRKPRGRPPTSPSAEP